MTWRSPASGPVADILTRASNVRLRGYSGHRLRQPVRADSCGDVPARGAGELTVYRFSVAALQSGGAVERRQTPGRHPGQSGQLVVRSPAIFRSAFVQPADDRRPLFGAF